MKIHWKILIWLVAGAIGGGLLQAFVPAGVTSGVTVTSGHANSVAVKTAPANGSLKPGMLLVALVFHRGTPEETVTACENPEAYLQALRSAEVGDVVWHREVSGGKLHPVTLQLDPNSDRATWIRPFAFLADIFLRLLKMLIVPLILTSIVSGVVGVGTGRDLRRLGTKTFVYYIATSLLAAITGLLAVNLFRPGVGAELGLAADERFADVTDASFLEVLIRMVPENVFSAFGENAAMLQVIFFALLFGYFILKVEARHREQMKGFFEAAFEVMMKLAEAVLKLIPYGVFCLLVKVVGQTGFSVFKPLALYMATVVTALLVHSCLSLPLVLKLVGKVSPWRWARAVSPALITAFSTSSSSMTLPVSMETVEKRGGVPNRIVSFVQPLGATINMDGTALYECIGVIFLAQYYAGIDPHFDLSLVDQVQVVILALLASIGAAGIPSAGLIMMVTILAALGLPVEGAALLLAVDRPLDMLRTVVNVFSDTCGAAVVSASEGAQPLVDVLEDSA
ncbi:MAG: dicarboxylate/amino acid:cation symporter [Planctomycetes bacterium]|nr:dicarboxylate/amino acid:cation symporter [Planctomycetota bacterium]